jgi:hypothetical protein
LFLHPIVTMVVEMASPVPDGYRLDFTAPSVRADGRWINDLKLEAMT